VSGPSDRAQKSNGGGRPSVSMGKTNKNGMQQEWNEHHSPGVQGVSARSTMPPAREPGDLGAAQPMVGHEHLREEASSQSVGESPEESDAVIVPKKQTKTRVMPVESVEGRASAKGKSAVRNTLPAQDGQDELTYLQRIGERAKEKPKEKWNNLLSHIKVPLLKKAYQGLERKAAPGMDGITWEEYGENLDARLLDLQDRIHRGSYHPLPVKRVHIPKGDGKTRPLGLTTMEDKIVQQAARMILEPIYEAEFIGISYGFRPAKSAHDALDAVAAATQRSVNWVLDADLQSYFDTIDHGHLQRFIEQRIGDSRMVRLLMKWVKAGVLEDGKQYKTKEGTPQGGIISPLLANIYLHYVFDLWICEWRKQHAQGEVYAVRYADDLWLGFQKEEDVCAARKAMTERFEQYNLKLHPEKTRVIEFGRYAAERRENRRCGKPETFDFLGFTHICETNQHGKFYVKRRTSRKKRRAKLAHLKKEAKRRRHDPIGEQYTWVKQVLKGHCLYYGVPSNQHALEQFRRAFARIWHSSLQRRSQRGRWTTKQWAAMNAKYPIPQILTPHEWPDARFWQRHPKLDNRRRQAP
jgi:RNA-directed DNA polymerase